MRRARVIRFLLRRLYGGACIVDGLGHLLTPWRLGLSLRVARRIARNNFKFVGLG